MITCSICKKKKLTEVLNLGPQPLCDDLIKIKSKKINKNYKIVILFCKVCKTAHQKYKVKDQILFPKKYHYRSGLTKDVLNSMENLVDECENILGNLKNKNILDIGCNDGSLLSFFQKKGSNVLGVEPTNAHKDAKKMGIKVINNYYNLACNKKILKQFKEVDVITFTNVFAHINDIDETLNALKKIINKKTIIIIENHYLKSILNSFQFDTFYQEHPRTYSLMSFAYIAKRLNLNLSKVQFPKRYGGNIRVFLSKFIKTNSLSTKLLGEEKNFLTKFKKMNRSIDKWKNQKLLIIKKLNRDFGPLPAKAFPGRASILINTLGLNEKNISYISEQPGSKKIGHYVPGTRIPIVSDNKFLRNSKINVIINFAWHIEKEIKNYLEIIKCSSKILNIISKNDY